MALECNVLNKLRGDPPEYTPAYTTSVDPPRYTSRVAEHERRLEANRGSEFIFSQSDGIFSRSTQKKDITIHIYDQGDLLVYGRHSAIHGAVSVTSKASEVKQVTILLEGRLELSSRHMFDVVTLFQMQRTLWPQATGGSSLMNSRIPSEMPFSFRLPLTCCLERDKDSVALPPTFNLNKVDHLESSAFVKYMINVEVEMSKKSLFQNKTTRLVVPINYYPRSRPPLPTMMPPATFLMTLKSSPEEWMQKHSYIMPRQRGVDSLELHVVIPKGSIYPLSAPLPFYIQLRGATTAFELFSATPEDIKITATFVRRTGWSMNGRDIHKVELLGKGKCCYVSTEHTGEKQDSCGTSSTSWEGEITPVSEDNIPTFEAGKLYMKDYLCVSVFPDGDTSAFSTHRTLVPIQLVTDNFDSSESQSLRVDMFAME